MTKCAEFTFSPRYGGGRSTLCVGCSNVTERQSTDRQTI